MCLVWEAIERCSKPCAFEAMWGGFWGFVQQIFDKKITNMWGLKRVWYHNTSLLTTWGFNFPFVKSVFWFLVAKGLIWTNCYSELGSRCPRIQTHPSKPQTFMAFDWLVNDGLLIVTWSFSLPGTLKLQSPSEEIVHPLLILWQGDWILRGNVNLVYFLEAGWCSSCNPLKFHAWIVCLFVSQEMPPTKKHPETWNMARSIRVCQFYVHLPLKSQPSMIIHVGKYTVVPWIPWIVFLAWTPRSLQKKHPRHVPYPHTQSFHGALSFLAG